VHAVFACRFVEDQLRNQKSELWLDGAKEYVQYGEALLEEFKHVRADAAIKPLHFGAHQALLTPVKSRKNSGKNRLPAKILFCA
jgi:hypothetical protein